MKRDAGAWQVFRRSTRVFSIHIIALMACWSDCVADQKTKIPPETVATTFLDEDEKPSCNDYPPAKLGLSVLQEFDKDRSNKQVFETMLHYRLRSEIYRVKVAEPGPPASSGGRTYTHKYRDIVLAFHIVDEDLIERERAYLAEHGKGQEVVSRTKCDWSSNTKIILYSPLAFYDDADRLNIYYLQPRTFDVYVPSDQPATTNPGEEPTVGSKPLVKPFEMNPAAPTSDDLDTATHAPDIPEDTSSDDLASDLPQVNDRPDSGVYPWLKLLDLHELKGNEAVFVLDHFECSKEGNFFVGSMGTLAEGSSSDSRASVKVIRTAMYAANIFPGIAGDGSNRIVTESSVDPTHYWCVPKKEFCYKAINFGQFGVAAAMGEVVNVDQSAVYNLRLGFVPILEKIYMSNCFPQATEPKAAKENP